MTSLEQAFGLVLRQARERAGLEQVELADKAGYSRGHISRLENGHIEPSLTVLFNLAEALGISPQNFVARIERKRK